MSVSGLTAPTSASVMRHSIFELLFSRDEFGELRDDLRVFRVAAEGRLRHLEMLLRIRNSTVWRASGRELEPVEHALRQAETFLAHDRPRATCRRRGTEARVSSSSGWRIWLRIKPKRFRLGDSGSSSDSTFRVAWRFGKRESPFNPETPGRRRFGSILQEIRAPELLTLALLFHDVGKWREADRRAGKRAPGAKHARPARRSRTKRAQTMESLIQQRLEMSQAAFRRDSPKTRRSGSKLAELVVDGRAARSCCAS